MARGSDSPPDDEVAPKGWDVGVFAKFGLHVEKLAAEAKRSNDLEQFFWDNQPRVDRLIGQGVIAAGQTSALIPVGQSPPQGWRYEIRRMRIGGPLATDTPTGTDVLLFTSTQPPQDLNSLAAVDSSTVTLPWTSYWSAGQLPLGATERLWVAVIGGLAAQQFVVTASIIAFNESVPARAVTGG